ncbi:TetR/AcrR family transcriptional regulator [Pseudogracilibacillus auburnensis]|uniref:TetR/AcrR family transcriptional regulator n=1 Tax=Pseudogracilibacillus auburnensis TaxID=1494959 RepID=UPI001A969E13|nr:TetR/AcrR family transcriptional regulator [Pseudogracilibacillus auburnensis]MBO1005045.1 TetR/AcrR family transcriptional regulator [Pseudogracilibacillus auburnensis]
MKDNEKLDNELEGLPPGIAISWGLGKQPQRGPKRELSIKQIVVAAINIADKEGLAALSMNRLASSLGFTPMSLYRYIPSKDDLLLLMQEEIYDIDYPQEEVETDWREKMRQYVRICIKVFRDHPWFSDIPITSVPLTPNQLKWVDMALRTTRNLALNDDEKMSIVLLLSGYARWCGIITKDMDMAIQTGKRPSEISGLDYSMSLKKLVTQDRFPDLYPVLMSGAYTEENEDANDIGNDFDFGLERILDGIEHYLLLKKMEK